MIPLLCSKTIKIIKGKATASLSLHLALGSLASLVWLHEALICSVGCGCADAVCISRLLTRVPHCIQTDATMSSVPARRVIVECRFKLSMPPAAPGPQRFRKLRRQRTQAPSEDLSRVQWRLFSDCFLSFEQLK